MNTTVSERLNWLMESRGIKQVDLVNSINKYIEDNDLDVKIGKSAISQYVSGKVVPKQDKLFIMAAALDVDPSWLLGIKTDVHIDFADSSSAREETLKRLTAYAEALKKISIKSLFDTISELDDKQAMRVYDLLSDYLSCDEYSQGRISAYANMLAFGYADTKNIDAGVDKENAEFKGKFTRHLDEDDIDTSDEPDGPHPYHGPDEDLVRAVAERDTKKTLEDLKGEVKTKTVAREAKELDKGRPAK